MRLARKQNEEGNMILGLTLVFMFASVAIFMLNLPQLVTSSDVVLKNATTLAVRAAANQYEIGKHNNSDKRNGKGNDNKNEDFPKIDYQKAKSSFESILAKNLELNSNLQPDKYSSFAGSPSYKLLIYNGQENHGDPPGVIYEYRDGQTTITGIQVQGFPQTFTVAEKVRVKLETPGAIALVEAVPHSIAGSNTPSRRWAAATLVKQKNKNWTVVLQGRQS